MKMPLATFEGAIRVGQEKAAMAEEITLTFGLADAVAVEPAKVAVVNNEPVPLSTAISA
jgi:3-hydroxyacyl-[acyl-carrier-protein] dehydratase